MSVKEGHRKFNNHREVIENVTLKRGPRKCHTHSDHRECHNHRRPQEVSQLQRGPRSQYRKTRSAKNHRDFPGNITITEKPRKCHNHRWVPGNVTTIEAQGSDAIKDWFQEMSQPYRDLRKSLNHRDPRKCHTHINRT